MNICPRTLRITASNKKYCDDSENIIEITEDFSEWIHDGELISTAEEVANNYFYEYFDKGPYKIIETENISIDW